MSLGTILALISAKMVPRLIVLFPPITINLDRKVGQPVRLSFHLMPKLQ